MNVRVSFAILPALLLVATARAASVEGVVISVEKTQFTIRTNDNHPRTLTFKIGEGLRRPPRLTGELYSGRVKDLKKGIMILAEYRKDGKNFVCEEFLIEESKKPAPKKPLDNHSKE